MTPAQPSHTPQGGSHHKSVGVVVNPTAGLGKGKNTGAHAIEYFTAQGHSVHDLTAGNARDALARARAACMEHLDALVVVGGDGMVHLGVNAVIGTPTPLGIVPAGSGNDFARALGLSPRNKTGALHAINTALKNGTVQHVDAVQVEPYLPPAHQNRLTLGAQGTDAYSESVRRWYVGTLSMGLDAAVNAQANSYRWPSGHLKYLRAVIACVARFKPYGYALTIDGHRFESAGTLAAVSNAPMIGGGIRIAPQAKLNDGLMDVTFAQPLKLTGILKVFPKLYRGTHLNDPAVTVYTAREVIIEPTESGAFPPIAMADGEVVGPVPLKARVHPGALALLR